MGCVSFGLVGPVWVMGTTLSVPGGGRAFFKEQIVRTPSEERDEITSEASCPWGRT